MRWTKQTASLALVGWTLFSAPSPHAASEAATSDSLAPVVRRVAPAVVHVFAERNTSGDQTRLDPAFHGDGRGSGFVVDPAGLILTSEHIITDATRIAVRVSGAEPGSTPETYPAKVVGSDARTNLALLRIHPERELARLSLEDSDEVEAGDRVIVVADPTGQEKTVASGVIRARSAAVFEEQQTEIQATEVFETDARLHPEESGAPLLDFEGNVIGVTMTAVDIADPTRVDGFATPSSVASDVVEDLLKRGRVERGTLGLEVQGLTPQMAKSFGGVESGVLVSAVEPEGPAARTPVEAGDVILAVDGERILAPLDLAKKVAQKEIGESVRLDLLTTGGRRRSAEVEVSPESPPDGLAERAAASSRGIRSESLGAILAPDGADDAFGVAVESVDKGGPAEKAGILPGDTIERIFGRRLEDPASLEQELESHDRERPALLLLRRGQERSYVTVRLHDERRFRRR